MMISPAALRPALVLGLLLAVAVPGQADEWPTQVVGIEEMRMLTPMRIAVPRVRAKGEVKGPAVLRVHVDAEGLVHRTVLLESCGSSAHDEAAMHAMRAMRFAPKLVDGQPAAVSLVVPLHLPPRKTVVR